MKPILHTLLLFLAMVLSAMQSQGLQEPAMRELPMGSIKSAGWIEAELQTSLAALAGQLQAFYDNIRDGTFTGGKTSYSALNEAQPYYFQAGVAALYTAQNPPSGLRKWIDSTLQYFIDHQEKDGWFGPKPDYLWPRWPILLGAMHYVEASSNQQAKPILDFIYNFVNASHAKLATGDLGSSPDDGGKSGLDEWGAVRSAEYTMLLQWLYDNHPRDQATQNLLLNDMTLVRTLGNKKMGDVGGAGWTGFFTEQNINKDGNGPQNQRTHGVNIAMALKEAALKWRISGSQNDRDEAFNSWDILYKYHGKLAGHFAADEHLAGLSPERGAETCQVVENMWSSSVMYGVFGRGKDADRAESQAFNSLPAAMTGDWWGRQYLQQEMQLSSQSFKTNPFHSDGPESNIFGLETNYPCCTVNHPQGLPRFISRSYLTTKVQGSSEDALLHAYLIPTKVNTTLNGVNKVTVTADTMYPFEDTIRYTFNAQKPFTFSVRVPGWAKSAVLHHNDGQQVQSTVDGGGGNMPELLQLSVPAGQSSATYVVTSDVHFTNTPGGHANSVSVSKGALLYALPLNFTLAKLRQNSIEPKAIDNLRLPSNNDAWKLAIDTRSAKFIAISSSAQQTSGPIFAHGNAPVAVRVSACDVPKGWDPIDDGAWNKGFPPADIQCGNSTRFDVLLTPYGASKLRMATLASIIDSKSASDVALKSVDQKELQQVITSTHGQHPFAAGGLSS